MPQVPDVAMGSSTPRELPPDVFRLLSDLPFQLTAKQVDGCATGCGCGVGAWGGTTSPVHQGCSGNNTATPPCPCVAACHSTLVYLCWVCGGALRHSDEGPWPVGHGVLAPQLRLCATT